MISVVGFVGDVEGNGHALVSLDPVVRVGRDEYVARGGDWNESSLLRLSEQDLPYVHRIPVSEQTEIRPGQRVFLAGGSFVIRVNSFAILREFATELNANWGLWARGFRWRLGSRRELEQLRQRYGQSVEVQLHRCLFDSLEQAHGEAASSMDLYLALVTSASLRRFQNMGLFYKETRREADYRMTAIRAVAARVVTTPAEFDEKVEELSNWLRERRMSDAKVRPDVVAQASSRPGGFYSHYKAFARAGFDETLWTRLFDSEASWGTSNGVKVLGINSHENARPSSFETDTAAAN